MKEVGSQFFAGSFFVSVLRGFIGYVDIYDRGHI